MSTNKFLSIAVVILISLQLYSIYRQQNPATPTFKVESVVRNAPDGTTVDLSTNPMKGSVDAKVVLIEFSDYECPFCAKYANTTAQVLASEFVDSGKIRLAFVNNPLPIHDHARSLATIAICARKQDRFWEMHDFLYSDQLHTTADIPKLAKSLPVNSDELSACVKLQKGEAELEIDSDKRKAVSLKLGVTPSFAIGRLDGEKKVSIRKFVLGAQPVDVFREAINSVLLAP